MLKNNSLKWWQTIKISWVKHTTYRFNFLLQVIGPAVVFFFIKYNLWWTIFKNNPEKEINGHSFDEMIEYHIWTLIVTLIAQSYSAMDLAEEIRLGKISTYLIYPFNFWEFHTASFLSYQFLQILISAVTLFFLYSFHLIENIGPYFLINGLIYSLFVSFFWFSLQYFTGILGFWLEETWIVRVMLLTIATFLSGAIIPLDFFPQWAVNFLEYTPFPYLTFYPVKIFTGHHVNIPNAYLKLIFWTALLCYINRSIWKKGVRLYTAAGM